MNIDTAMRRKIEHGLGQEQAVCGDHHHIVRRGAQALNRCERVFRTLAACAERWRLNQRQSRLKRVLFDRRGHIFHASSGGAVRLREHQRHLKTLGVNRRQRCGGEGGGAGKYYFESLSHECSAIPIFLNTRNNSTVSPCRAPLLNNCHAPSGHSGADAFPCTISQRQAVFAVLSTGCCNMPAKYCNIGASDSPRGSLAMQSPVCQTGLSLRASAVKTGP